VAVIFRILSAVLAFPIIAWGNSRFVHAPCDILMTEVYKAS